MCAYTLDQLFTYDQVSMCNSAGVEVLVRRLKGLELSLLSVHDRSQLSRKTDDWWWMDLVRYTHEDPDLQDEIRRQRQHTAEQHKWATKSAGSQGRVRGGD